LTGEGTLPVSVVIPTLGRASLRACVASIADCRPAPAEVVLVVQDGYDTADALAAEFARSCVRVVRCEGRGVSRGRNVGLREAAHETVLITDDDCTVHRDWVERAVGALQSRPRAIVTGRVVPVGDPRYVPSHKDDPVPYDFTGRIHGGALFPNNMVCGRSAVLEAGGFDERFGPAEAAEDNEFCYRWLRDGRELVYEPALVVEHHEWRTPEQLERLYVRYARGQGFFYAKHLRRRDPTMLRWIARDLYWAARALAAAALGRHPRWLDPRRGILPGLPGGLVHGWRVFSGERAP
jgi:glycosyltransferase involved in cell wall biosynthesis